MVCVQRCYISCTFRFWRATNTFNNLIGPSHRESCSRLSWKTNNYSHEYGEIQHMYNDNHVMYTDTISIHNHIHHTNIHQHTQAHQARL